MSISNISVKNQNEFLLFYTFREIGVIGHLNIDTNGTTVDDYTDLVNSMTQENQTALSGGTYGNTLYLNVEARAVGAEPMVIVVSGTDQLDAAASEEVVIPARTQVDQTILVSDPTSGQKWKTITSVLVKDPQPANHNITLGTTLQLIIFPIDSDFIAPKGKIINFDNGFSWNKGSTSRAIPNKFNPVDHYKRIRGENSISITQLYTLDEDSLQFLRDRDVTIKAEIHEDGSAEITETHYFSFVRLNTPMSAGGDGADVSQDADGNFRQHFVR